MNFDIGDVFSATLQIHATKSTQTPQQICCKSQRSECSQAVSAIAPIRRFHHQLRQATHNIPGCRTLMGGTGRFTMQ